MVRGMWRSWQRPLDQAELRITSLSTTTASDDEGSDEQDRCLYDPPAA